MLWLQKCFPSLERISPNQVHLCLLNVDERHCGDPLEWFSQTKQVVLLSREEQHQVIKMYAKLDQEIKLEDTCTIGVGYTTC